MAESIITEHFSRNFHDLTDKNLVFKRQIVKKIAGIRQNPEIGEPKSGNLRGLRGLHISEHFVIIYFIYNSIDSDERIYGSNRTVRLRNEN